uniref:31 kDa protein n=1 Tax=Donkey orchid symptomless virus TaxID=1400526 RepID=A0A0F7KL20_9VIRU|nr:31 kDa protein [Donkey orchid symptomless virus]
MLPHDREELKEAYRFYCHNKDETKLPSELEDAIIKSGQEEQLHKFHRINYELVFNVLDGKPPTLPPAHDTTKPDAEHQAFEARCRSFITAHPNHFPGEFSRLSGQSVFITRPFRNIEGWHHELYIHYNLYLAFKAYGYANHFIIPPVPKRSAGQFLFRYYDRNIERLILAKTQSKDAHYYDPHCPSGVPSDLSVQTAPGADPQTSSTRVATEPRPQATGAAYCHYHQTEHVRTSNILCLFEKVPSPGGTPDEGRTKPVGQITALSYH